MAHDKTTIERAFELAKSGKYASVSDIRAAVVAEGYSSAQLTGPSLMRQIRTLMREASASPSL